MASKQLEQEPKEQKMGFIPHTKKHTITLLKLHSQKFHFIPGTYVLLILMFTLNFRVKQVLLLFLPGSGHQNIKLRHFEILSPTCKFGL